MMNDTDVAIDKNGTLDTLSLPLSLLKRYNHHNEVGIFRLSEREKVEKANCRSGKDRVRSRIEMINSSADCAESRRDRGAFDSGRVVSLLRSSARWNGDSEKGTQSDWVGEKRMS